MHRIVHCVAGDTSENEAPNCRFHNISVPPICSFVNWRFVSWPSPECGSVSRNQLNLNFEVCKSLNVESFHRAHHGHLWNMIITRTRPKFTALALNASNGLQTNSISRMQISVHWCHALSVSNVQVHLHSAVRERRTEWIWNVHTISWTKRFGFTLTTNLRDSYAPSKSWLYGLYRHFPQADASSGPSAGEFHVGSSSTIQQNSKRLWFNYLTLT